MLSEWGKYGPEKLQTRTLFTQCLFFRKVVLSDGGNDDGVSSSSHLLCGGGVPSS